MAEARDLNSGTEWSEMAIEDLRHALESGETIESAARFLCRSTDVAEVARKARELGLSVRHENEPRRIDVAYTDGHWLTQLSGEADVLDYPTLMQLIKAVQRALPDQALLFVVDYTTIEFYFDAELQFIEASEKSGAMVITSVQEF